jgi:Leucine-rich repeat (LRR) protein
MGLCPILFLKGLKIWVEHKRVWIWRMDLDFDIEKYFDTISSNTEKIDLSYGGLIHLSTNISRFTKLKILKCNNNKLTKLPPLPESLEILSCYNNQLTELPELNVNLQRFVCHHNQLSSLPPLNEKLEELCCDDNQLTELPKLNKKLRELYCSNNRLTKIPILNEQLIKLYCGNNQLTEIPPLNKNLKTLYCENNRLNYLPLLNETLESLWYVDNPIYEIIENDALNISRKEVKILNDFRFSYYCLKFKKRFRDWLWVRIREPRIREKYHPDYLLEHLLNEETDLDMILENW